MPTAAPSHLSHAPEVDCRPRLAHRTTEEPSHGIAGHPRRFEVARVERRPHVGRQVRQHARSAPVRIRPAFVRATCFRGVRRRRPHVRLDLDMRETRGKRRFDTPSTRFDSRRLHPKSTGFPVLLAFVVTRSCPLKSMTASVGHGRVRGGSRPAGHTTVPNHFQSSNTCLADRVLARAPSPALSLLYAPLCPLFARS